MQLRAWAAAVAVAYGLALPMLGLQDMMAPTMFANLRVFSGSNHTLMPTGILYDGGGVVWVESSTAEAIKDVYPAEVSKITSPRARVHAALS